MPESRPWLIAVPLRPHSKHLKCHLAHKASAEDDSVEYKPPKKYSFIYTATFNTSIIEDSFLIDLKGCLLQPGANAVGRLDKECCWLTNVAFRIFSLELWQACLEGTVGHSFICNIMRNKTESNRFMSWFNSTLFLPLNNFCVSLQDKHPPLSTAKVCERGRCKKEKEKFICFLEFQSD